MALRRAALGRSTEPRRASAVCSANSAACTLPASCSCWAAMETACSTSASTRSSRLREKAWYMVRGRPADPGIRDSLASRAPTWPWEVLQVFLGLPGEGARLLGGGVAVGEAAGQVFLEVGEAAAGFGPPPAQQGQRHGGDDDGRTTPGGRGGHRAGGLDGREAGNIAHGREFNPDGAGFASGVSGPEPSMRPASPGPVRRPGRSRPPGRGGDARVGHEDRHRLEHLGPGSASRWPRPRCWSA